MVTSVKENTVVAVELLRQMKRIRFVEETIAERYSEWKMRCPTHLCTGQEAIAAGVCLGLRDDDFVVSSHRAHGHYLAKGGDLNRMIAEIYGKSTGCSAGKGGSMHLIDKSAGFMGSTAIVGGTIAIATGLALSIRLHNTDQVSCVFLGDGAVEEGVFYESLNFAALKKLPVLFICENNLYSVYSPLWVRQPPGRKISEMVESIGVSAEQGDGNNAIEVYKKVTTAVESIRNGSGPRFFEFATYRWREHCGPNFDNDIGYRTEQEFLHWEKQDPILALESSLLDNNLISQPEIEIMEASLRREVNEAFEYAEASAFPETDEAFTGLYNS